MEFRMRGMNGVQKGTWLSNILACMRVGWQCRIECMHGCRTRTWVSKGWHERCVQDKRESRAECKSAKAETKFGLEQGIPGEVCAWTRGKQGHGVCNGQQSLE
eukprot:1158140-Pelagomonas_calceolata.AAC.3